MGDGHKGVCFWDLGDGENKRPAPEKYHMLIGRSFLCIYITAMYDETTIYHLFLDLEHGTVSSPAKPRPFQWEYAQRLEIQQTVA